MRKTKSLTKKNRCIRQSKWADYLKDVLKDEEYYSTFEDLYKEAESIKGYGYGNFKHLTPSLITAWLQGLPLATEYITYNICVMILQFLNLDTRYAEKLGDADSIYMESQTDIDKYYWETLGDIIYREHFLSNTEKTSGDKR